MRKMLLGGICAVTAALMLLFPAPFLMDMRNRVLEHWLFGGKIAYEGDLSVWVVDVRADGKQSLLSWIRGRIAFYEAGHFGIYPKVEGPMTIEEVQLRMRNGAHPDVLLCGVDVPEPILENAVRYDGPFLMDPILPQRSEGLITPILQSGTLVLLNEDALYRAGLNPPAGLSGMDSQWLQTVLQELPNAAGHEDGVCLMAAVMSEMPQAMQQAFLKSKRGNLDALLKGELAIYLSQQGSLWQLYKQDLLGKTLPGVIAYPLSGLSPRMQCAVLIKNNDRHRHEAAAALITTLLGKQAQTALADIYALPVVTGTSCVRADLVSLWQKAEETEWVYPNTGEAEFLTLVSKDAPLSDLQSYVRNLCRPP